MTAKRMVHRDNGQFFRRVEAIKIPGRRACGILMVLSILSSGGCQTTSPVSRKTESKEDVSGAISAVAGALSGKQLSKEELRNLEGQIRTDKGAQTAIQAITESVGGKTPVVKYCPVSGRRYAAHMEICPEHNVKLEVVDQ